MGNGALQAAACVPDNPNDVCWKIKLLNFTKDPAGKPHAGKNYIVRAGGKYKSGVLNGDGESIVFSAPPDMDKSDIYFDLKILPDYNADLNKCITEAYGNPATGGKIKAALLVKQLIWGGKDTDDPKPHITNTCAAKVSYVLNRGTDCEFTIPRILVKPDGKSGQELYNQQLSEPKIESQANLTKSHGIPANMTKWVTEGAGDSYRYILRVNDLNVYLPTIYPDTPYNSVPDIASWFSGDKKNSIFVLTNCGWGDATGHYDFSVNKHREPVSGYFGRCSTLAVYLFTYVKCIGKTEENGVKIWTFHHVLRD
ncbi:hypothetical protein C4J81_00680 [Deltaproteobacteria bacterium Smac51]|nr:hypothetical protein C4J81_00680 [Deltaproteobacteria bacterium Smac51]